MAYSLVTATDFADLLSKLATFATAQGWTVTWNTGSQMGLHSGACYAAFGPDPGSTNPASETDTYPDPDVAVSDFRIRGSLGKDFVGHASHYWGLTGSPVTSAGDQDACLQNDLLGPFAEVHFFGDSTYIWVVLRTDTDRYTHFGFGNLDKKGMTHPDVGFLCMNFWRWWDNDTSGSIPIKRHVNYTSGYFGNKPWMKDGYGNYLTFIQDGTLDPAFGIADDVINRINLSNSPTMPTDVEQSYDSNNNTRLTDHWRLTWNKPLTGGIPLITMPLLYQTGLTADSLLCYLGDFPGFRLCNIANVAIGEEIEYGSETWLAFPLVRRTGSSYDGKASSYNFGVAFRKG